MKGQLYSVSQQSLTQSSSLDHLHPARSYLRPWADPPSRQLYYNWTTSLPRNWKKISPKPVHLLSSTAGNRSTLDFLRETMRYIGQIASPKSSAPRRSDNKLRHLHHTARLKTVPKRPLPQSPPSKPQLKPLQLVSFPTRISETRKNRREKSYKATLTPRLLTSEPCSPQWSPRARGESRTVMDVRRSNGESPRPDSNSIKE